MLKTLKKEHGLKWKDDITPVIPPRPKVYYKVDQSKDQALKKKKYKNSKTKKNKIEECKQDSPEMITLQHFISKEDWEKITLSRKENTDEEINEKESEKI
jgi:hypothetical protein